MSNENNSSVLVDRNTLVGLALPPSTLGKLENQLYAPGGLLEQPAWRPTPEQAANYVGYIASMVEDGRRDQMLTFAGQKVIGATTGFNDNNLGNARFAGGICALSTFESRSLVTNPPDDVEQYLEETLEPISIAQVFEAVGQTKAGESLVVLEDTLWADKVRKRLEASGIPVDEAAVSRAIARRNQRAFDATQRLRDVLRPGARPLIPVRDTEVMEDLQVQTDQFLRRLGVSIDRADTYRYVYAGMYSGVWRRVLLDAGLMYPDETLVIYEPTKHIVSVDGRSRGQTPEAQFRREMLDKAPYLRRGSFNEQVGVIAYVEPIFPNGRRFRDVVPVEVMPNSSNYRDFDFSRFPILPTGKYDEAAVVAAGLWSSSDRYFFDKIGTMKLGENPAFLWGSMYPPTPELAVALYKMAWLSVKCREAVFEANAKALEAALAGEKDAPRGAQRGDISNAIRAQFSVEMAELSERVIAELQRITRAMFEGVAQ